MNSRFFLMLIVIGLTAGCAADALPPPGSEPPRDSTSVSRTPVGQRTPVPRPTLSPVPDVETASAPVPLSTLTIASPTRPLQPGQSPATPAPGERVPLRRVRTQEEIVGVARQHLADRLGLPLEEIMVVSVEEAWWEDDALGCPRLPGHYPDRAYPGPIPGYRIILYAKNAQYEYHSGRLWLIFCRRIGE